jgi:hypothetical protein
VSQDDVVWLIAFLSPVVAWATGAWILNRRRGASVAWLAVSILLMTTGLVGIYADVAATRQEKLTGQYTTHLAAFGAMLLQWFVAIALLAVIGVLGAVMAYSRTGREARDRLLRTRAETSDPGSPASGTSPGP